MTWSCAAFLIYAGAFCALLLPKLLPVRPNTLLANSSADGAIFLWSIGWWPHAIARGILLPYTHSLFAPGGTNLMWTTSVPFPSVLLWPVTRAFGAFATFNALSILAPITAATTTYLLAHRVTRRWGPSLVAGFLFAASPLEASELAIGHLNLTLLALLPLAAYLVVRRLEGSMRPSVFVALLAIVLWAQFGTSTEVTFTTTLFGAIALLMLALWDPGRRPAIRRCAALIAVAYLAAGILASPLLYTAIARPHPHGVIAFGSSSVAPMSGVRTVIGSTPSTPARSSGVPAGVPRGIIAALQLPLFAVLLHLAWTKRRRPVMRALGLTALIVAGCAAGVVVVGSTVLPTPWRLAAHVPVLRLVRPQRLSMFVWLTAAVGVGVWLADRRAAPLRVGAAALILAPTLPAFFSGAWTSSIPASPLPTAGPSSIAGANILVVAGPAGPGSHQLDDLATPTVWQEEAGFSFRLADAYVGSFAPALPDGVRRLVLERSLPPSQTAPVLAWLHSSQVGAVLLMQPTPAAVDLVERLLGHRPIPIGGIVLFPVAAG